METKKFGSVKEMLFDEDTIIDENFYRFLLEIIDWDSWKNGWKIPGTPITFRGGCFAEVYHIEKIKRGYQIRFFNI